MHGCLYTCTICKLRLDNQSFTLIYFNNFFILNDEKGFSCMQLPPDGHYLHYLICKFWVQKEQNEHDHMIVQLFSTELWYVYLS